MFIPPPAGKDDERSRKPDEAGPGEQDLYAYVAECLRRGSKPSEVRKQLVAMGHTPEDAAEIVRRADRAGPGFVSTGGSAYGGVGQRNMMIGALICAAGLIITMITYAATSRSGSSFILAYGAIVGGAVQFFRGLAQSSCGE